MPDELNLAVRQVEEGAGIGEPAALALQHGRLVMTAVSKKSGQHVTVRATAKSKVGGKWKTVPLIEATHVFCDVPSVDGGFPNKIGTYYFSGRYAGKFWSDQHADKARVWCAQRVLRIAAGVAEWEDEQCSILKDTYCLLCGRELTDPLSIERQIGPTCYGQMTGSRHQVKQPDSAQEALAVERAGLPAGAEGSRHPFTDDELGEINERSGAIPEPAGGLRRLTPGMTPAEALAARRGATATAEVPASVRAIDHELMEARLVLGDAQTAGDKVYAAAIEGKIIGLEEHRAETLKAEES